MKSKFNGLRFASVTSFIGAGISLYMGFNKMYVYQNFDIISLRDSNKNVHVGGDAYNYIINGTHSTAFFVLFGALLIAGIGFEILKAILDHTQPVIENEVVGKEGEENVTETNA